MLQGGNGLVVARVVALQSVHVRAADDARQVRVLAVDLLGASQRGSRARSTTGLQICNASSRWVVVVHALFVADRRSTVRIRSGSQVCAARLPAETPSRSYTRPVQRLAADVARSIPSRGTAGWVLAISEIFSCRVSRETRSLTRASMGRLGSRKSPAARREFRWREAQGRNRKKPSPVAYSSGCC